MATDRLSVFELGTGDEIKGTTRRRAASSCNAFAIATFSSFSLKLRKHIYISMRNTGKSTGKTTYSSHGLSASCGSQLFLSSSVMQCAALHHVTQLDI